MKIILEKAGKKFYKDWIFRNLDFEISAPGSLAILGPNGSGKSTLLQLISGSMLPTEGIVRYNDNGNEIKGEDIFRQVSFASPYLELIEEFTLDEIIRFHFSFKKSLKEMSHEEIVSSTGLASAKNKIFKYFSSGMKQRVKLSLAILSDVKITLLDEPCSNLDEEGMKWYRQLTDEFTMNKIMIICSNNQPLEYEFCTRRINLSDFK